MAVAPDRTLDTSGTFCPVPIIELARLMKDLEPGKVVSLVATDPGIQTDLPAWCKSTRNQLLELTREGAVFRGLVRKAPG